MSPSLASSPTRPLSRESTPTPALPAGAQLVLLRPPDASVLSASADLAGAAEVPGTVVGVWLSRPKFEREALGALLADLSRRAPSCPVVVLLDLPPEEALLLAARLAPLRPRAVVPVGASMLPVLREALTDPATLPAGAAEWLRLWGVRFSPNPAAFLERTLAAAPEHAHLAETTLRSIRIERARRGRPRTRPHLLTADRLTADRAYNSRAYRQYLRRRCTSSRRRPAGWKPRRGHPVVADAREYARRRIVERTFT